MGSFFLCVISMEPVDCIRSMLPNRAGSSFSVDKNNTDTLSAQPTDAAPRDPGVWPRLLPNSEVHIIVPYCTIITIEFETHGVQHAALFRFMVGRQVGCSVDLHCACSEAECEVFLYRVRTDAS